jgi:hypothetical protein
MADWPTIASLATAGGTLVLALATFSSVRSGQRSTQIAERALLIGLRPVLVPSRVTDPLEAVRFVEGRMVSVHGGMAVRKLDVRSRGEAAAEALRLGLTPRGESPVKDD